MTKEEREMLLSEWIGNSWLRWWITVLIWYGLRFGLTFGFIMLACQVPGAFVLAATIAILLWVHWLAGVSERHRERLRAREEEAKMRMSILSMTLFGLASKAVLAYYLSHRDRIGVAT